MRIRVYPSEGGKVRATVTNPRTGHREKVAPAGTKEELKAAIADALNTLYAKDPVLLPR